MKRSDFDNKFKEIAKKAKALSNLWINENAAFNVGDRVSGGDIVFVIQKVGWQNRTESMIQYEVIVEGENKPFLMTEEKLIEAAGRGT